MLAVDALTIVLEALSRHQATSDGTSLVDLCLHGEGTPHRAILRHEVDDRLCHGDARSGPREVMFTLRRAVLADVDILARELLCLVVLASLVRQSMLANIVVSLSRVTTTAITAGLAIEQHLGRQSNLRPRAIPHDRDSVSESSSHTLCPAARALPTWKVLIGVPGDEASARNISPVPRSRKLGLRHLLVRTGSEDELAADVLPVEGGNSARRVLLLLLLFVSAQEQVRRLRLGFIRGLVIAGQVLLPLPSFLQDALTIVARSSPRAVLFDMDVVDTSGHTCPTVVSPIGTPRVAKDPIVLAVLAAITDNADDMVNLRLVLLIFVDIPAGVADEVRRCSDGAGDGAALQLGHDGVQASYAAVLRDAIDMILWCCSAAIGVAGGANVLSMATSSRVVTNSFVGLACLIRNASMLVDELVHSQSIPSVASEVRLVAIQDNLHCQIDFSSNTSLGDLDAVGESCRGAERIAGPTKFRDVLISRHCGVVSAVLRTPVELGWQVVELVASPLVHPGFAQKLDRQGVVQVSLALGDLWAQTHQQREACEASGGLDAAPHTGVLGRSRSSHHLSQGGCLAKLQQKRGQ
mmetsp:Transcript_23280/g.51109  ORF Transcript_23280/g.51109 Transcript_23280/m.51109 type:complete len:581 (-) Transcript_23280:35-1777(-)